jgi:tetratricopeptide (TPR) repeat protein
MVTIPEAVETALAHHQAGRLAQAEQIYRQVLQADPRNAGAMHLLGLIAIQVGRYDAAVEQITRAIRLSGRQAAFHTNLGEAYRGLGRLDDATLCYQQALSIEPNLAEAHNNLGTILQARGQVDAAIDCYRKAIAAKPGYADAHNNLGTAFQAQGQWDSAVGCYRKAVEVAPGYAKGYYNLGVALGAQQQFAPARAAFEQAIALANNYAEAHYGLALALQKLSLFDQAEAAYRRSLELKPMAEAASSLGTVYQAQGKPDLAIDLYRRALAIDPNYAEAHYNWGTALKDQGREVEAAEKYRQAIRLRPTMADAHYNLGTVLQQLGQLRPAAAAYQEAIRLRPDLELAHNNLGNIYKLEGDLARAIECYERAIQLHPDQVEAFNNLGSVLQQQGQLDETIACYHRALKSKPDSAEAYSNLGTALQEQGKPARALACYQTSLRLQPDFAEAHYNLSLLLLSQQKLAAGWPEFAWRQKCKNYPRRAFAQPMWDGSPLRGRTLLVHAEQGFGDTLHFIRYLSHLRQQSGTIVFEVQPALVPLLRQSGFHEVIGNGTPLPRFDLHVPVLDLPRLFGTTLETIPTGVPYLAADPTLVEHWRGIHAQQQGLKVGLAWQGNRAYAFDRNRSIPLKEFAPLAGVDGLALVSLQKGEGSKQLAGLAERLRIHDLGPQLDEQSGPFMDTAAVMKNLDLVITSDTVTAHLAGALGVRTWVALSAVPEWRWFLDREDSPWYPTMRLFRQRSPGNWPEVFDRMASELKSGLA